MTVKEYLNQAYRLDLRIQGEMEDLDALRQMSESLSSPGFEEHYNATRNTDAPFVKTMEKITELEQRVNEEVDRLVDLKEQITETIKTVPDVNERIVLRCHYIKNMTWKAIGKKMNADSRTVRRWHDAALSHVLLPENPIEI